MPPKNVNTIRELIYWEYAKLIAGSAVGDRKNFGFIMHTYKKLNSGQINPSAILRENKKLVLESNKCAYCDSTENLQWEHIIPKSKNGPDTIDNMVMACGKCNQSKGAKDLFEWYGESGIYDIPRVVLGKYLKLIYDYHEQNGTLNASDINRDGTFNVYDLGVQMTG